ncbi:hypothetical protein EPT59_00155 [Lactiplantibacillus plantarum]|nr:hypothetical protein EPT59_00155 [Lactiplantibacillus plantarum]
MAEGRLKETAHFLGMQRRKIMATELTDLQKSIQQATAALNGDYSRVIVHEAEVDERVNDYQDNAQKTTHGK